MTPGEYSKWLSQEYKDQLAMLTPEEQEEFKQNLIEDFQSWTAEAIQEARDKGEGWKHVKLASELFSNLVRALSTMLLKLIRSYQSQTFYCMYGVHVFGEIHGSLDQGHDEMTSLWFGGTPEWTSVMDKNAKVLKTQLNEHKHLLRYENCGIQAFVKN